MKTILKISLVTIFYLISAMAWSQAFLAAVEDEGLATFYNNPCTIVLSTGEKIQGRFHGGTYVKDGLSKITIKLDNEEKVKYKPEQIVSLRIKASEWMRLAMVSSSASSLSEMENAHFVETMNRDSVIFETALAAKKTDTYRLLQLVNPGFDSLIKVFAEPSAKTGGINVGGIQVTGGEDKAYLFVKGSEKAFVVKKGSYDKNFEELFADCAAMLSAFEGHKIIWDDVALHVYVYDQMCKP
jgi:hypothetical protein